MKNTRKQKRIIKRFLKKRGGEHKGRRGGDGAFLRLFKWIEKKSERSKVNTPIKDTKKKKDLRS